MQPPILDFYVFDSDFPLLLISFSKSLHNFTMYFSDCFFLDLDSTQHDYFLLSAILGKGLPQELDIGKIGMFKLIGKKLNHIFASLPS